MGAIGLIQPARQVKNWKPLWEPQLLLGSLYNPE